MASLLQSSGAMWYELNAQVVAGWNGMAIQAFAQASLVLGSEETAQPREFPVEGCPPSAYLQAALQVCFIPIMTVASAAALLSHSRHLHVDAMLVWRFIARVNMASFVVQIHRVV